MQINKVPCGNIYNSQTANPKRRVCRSQTPAFAGKGDMFVKNKPAKGFMSKVKQVLNFIFPKKTSPLQLVDKIYGSDFSKLEGELLENGHKVIKNSEGTVVRRFVPNENGTRLESIYDYAPKTGCRVKLSVYREDGKGLAWVDEYDPKTGNRLKTFLYQKDGKTILSKTNYDPKTERRIKITVYRKNGKTIDHISEYDPKTGDCVKETSHLKNGKWIVVEYAHNTHTKITEYQKDGKTLIAVDIFDPFRLNVRFPVKSIGYQKDGKTLKYVSEDDQRGKIKTTFYQKDGKTLKMVLDEDKHDFYDIKKTYYKTDGTVDYIEEITTSQWVRALDMKRKIVHKNL